MRTFTALLMQLSLALAAATSAATATVSVSDIGVNQISGRKHLRSLLQQPAGSPFCSDAKSPTISGVSGAQFQADLSGTKNIQPNATGVAAPLETPARGSYQLTVDEQGQRASWTLQLCDVPQYTAAHLHIGSPTADYQPPLIPLDPFVRPSDPFAPATLLPQQCPAKNISGCSFNVQGSFTAADIIALPGKPNDAQVPAVTNFQDFLNALKAGNIYANVHSAISPTGLIRGNLAATGGTAQGTNQAAAETLSSSPEATPSATQAGPDQSGTNGAMGGNPMPMFAGMPGFATAPNVASSFASARSGPGGTQTEQGTYTRGNADADARADANRGGR